MNLVIRCHRADGLESEGIYSTCERFRYALTRTWDPCGRRLVYVMLNPSTATEQANDPTIERCERRAGLLGFGAFKVVNLFALRETSPNRLMKACSPEGSENFRVVSSALAWADDVICAWGVHGTHRRQDRKFLKLVSDCGKPLRVLGLTKEGHPRHPLYVPYSVQPVVWTPQHRQRQPM